MMKTNLHHLLTLHQLMSCMREIKCIKKKKHQIAFIKAAKKWYNFHQNRVKAVQKQNVSIIQYYKCSKKYNRKNFQSSLQKALKRNHMKRHHFFFYWHAPIETFYDQNTIWLRNTQALKSAHLSRWHFTLSPPALFYDCMLLSLSLHWFKCRG